MQEAMEKMVEAVFETVLDEQKRNEEVFDRASKEISEGRARIAQRSTEFEERMSRRRELMGFIKK